MIHGYDKNNDDLNSYNTRNLIDTKNFIYDTKHYCSINNPPPPPPPPPPAPPSAPPTAPPPPIPPSCHHSPPLDHKLHTNTHWHTHCLLYICTVRV